MPNRLAREASPYLLQHANNPVDWYPWGPEALEAAKRLDRPILLSIGYSACHWCHVMEHESFEDPETARLMNDSFVSIKVDREERPDLDQVYQLVVQLMGRSGGWPLTVFLTPDQKPFFGGTYFPPVDRYGMPSFSKVLRAIEETYRVRRAEIDAQSDEMTEAILGAAQGERGSGRGERGEGDVTLGPDMIARAVGKLVARFDDTHGGFGSRPKFPSPMSVELLARGGQGARAKRTLDAMQAGGIWDHLGGGFHRYSTDERWLVPHFEKMLYDNALLLRLYVDGWRATRDQRYVQTASALADYVAREMTAPEGGFYSAQDADSEGEEGRFFVWTPAQVDAALAGDPEAAAAAKRVFGIGAEGNFEQSGATVLSWVEPPASPEEGAALERARRAMFDARETRPRPMRDEKILASWNALLIGALADAGMALDRPPMVKAAAKAMAYLEDTLLTRDDHGHVRVLRLAKDGVAKGQGFLDDHAFVADAALDLYEATGEPRYVRLARSLADALLAHFHDPEHEGFFFTPDDGEAILVRAKDLYDHATPSGASVACRVLLRLGTLVDEVYADPATRAIERLAPSAADNPGGMSGTVALADRLVRGSVDIVVVGPRDAEATIALVRAAFRGTVRDRVLSWLDPRDPDSVAACALLGKDKPARPEPVAYVCRGRTCSAPVSTPEALAALLAHE